MYNVFKKALSKCKNLLFSTLGIQPPRIHCTKKSTNGLAIKNFHALNEKSCYIQESNAALEGRSMLPTSITCENISLKNINLILYKR